MKIKQFLYGSVPTSAGYSVLAQSPTMSEEEGRTLITLCERTDQQLHAAPQMTRSLRVRPMGNQSVILLEITGGWRDQVGRSSRVMRANVIEQETWHTLGGNPFILLSLLPSLKPYLPKKRNETNPIPDLDLATVSAAQWQRLWQKETLLVFHLLRALSPEDRLFWELIHHQPLPQLIATQADRTILGRIATYLAPREKREILWLETFSLNQEPVLGLSFRYRPYCPEETRDVGGGDKPEGRGKPCPYMIVAPTLIEKLAWIAGGVPPAHHLPVLSSLLVRHRRRELGWWSLFWVGAVMASVAASCCPLPQGWCAQAITIGGGTLLFLIFIHGFMRWRGVL